LPGQDQVIKINAVTSQIIEVSKLGDRESSVS
jgi:hypothetical protein